MRKLLLVAVLAMFTFSTNAQTFGAKAGLNLANVSGDVEDNKSLTAFHIGAVAEFEISDQFSFQPELVYSIQGAAYETELLGTTFEGKEVLSYLNIPLMAKYYVAEGFSLQAGPQIGFLMSAKSEFGDEDDDIKDDTKGVDFALGFGAGYKMDSGLFFDARYNLGLSDLVDERDDDDDNRVKNSVISLSVGYSFL